MSTKSLMAACAAATLALNALVTVATAAEATGRCGFDSVQQETATGENYEGVAYGVAVDDAGGAVSIHCYVTVNGTPQPGAAVFGAGTGATTVAGPISFRAPDGADVELCTQVNGGTAVCEDSTHSQLPPQEIFDLLDSVEEMADVVVCPLLAEIHAVTVHRRGLPNPEIDHEGDVFVDGTMVWDCPVYGDDRYDA